MASASATSWLMVPALAFPSSWPRGYCTRAKPSAGWPWSPTTMATSTLIGVPNTWPFSRARLAAGVREYGLPLVDHLYSMGHPPFQLFFSCEGWPPLHLCDLISVPSLPIWTVLGSLLWRLCNFTFSLGFLGVRRPALGPALPYRCGLLRSAVFSLALLSRYPPSRVSPINTRRSALRLARRSKVPVIGSWLGSWLDSPSRPLTVPL